MLALAFLPLVACGGERPALPVATVETKAASEAVTVRHTLAQVGTVEATPTSVPIAPMTTLSGATAQAVPAEWPAQLTEGEMDLVLALAGWPREWWAEAKAVFWCESKWSPGAIGDSGRSLGLAQLWTGWFREGEDPMDPVTNAAVALRVRLQRGRWGGGGGWTCADLLGIY